VPSGTAFLFVGYSASKLAACPPAAPLQNPPYPSRNTFACGGAIAS
jgi:hypothetical protein